MTLEASSRPPTAAPRLLSLDALRGFDMFWILGADLIAEGLGKMTDAAPIQFIAKQLDHKPWAGFAFYDLIFPMFVFIVGVSSVFSLTKIVAEHGRGAAVKRILLRAALLFLFGIFYNGGLTNRWPDIRLAGVLQRIAIAYAAAGLLFCYCKPRVLAGVAGTLLVGYWALLTFVPIRDIRLERKALEALIDPGASTVPAVNTDEGHASPARRTPPPPMQKVRELYAATTTYVHGKYESGYNVANHFDFEHLPGAKYDKYWDPEGYLSTFPAIATCLLGIFAGLALQRSDWDAQKKVATLAFAGVACVIVGFTWGLQFPVVKKIWTSTFVLVAGGWSLLLLALFYYVIDVKQRRRWATMFVWIGMNSITLYLLTAVMSFQRVAQKLVGGDVKAFFETSIAKGAGDLVIEIVALALMILIARFLYVRKIFLRV